MNEPRQGHILLVVPDQAGEFAADILERMDHPVTVCHGPSPERPCPLLAGEHCPHYEEAHGIVFSLDLGVPEQRRILAGYEDQARQRGRDLPIRVVLSPGSPPLGELLAGARTWPHEPTVAELDGFASEVEAADRFA